MPERLFRFYSDLSHLKSRKHITQNSYIFKCQKIAEWLKPWQEFINSDNREVQEHVWLQQGPGTQMVTRLLRTWSLYLLVLFWFILFRKLKLRWQDDHQPSKRPCYLLRLQWKKLHFFQEFQSFLDFTFSGLAKVISPTLDGANPTETARALSKVMVLL